MGNYNDQSSSGSFGSQKLRRGEASRVVLFVTALELVLVLVIFVAVWRYESIEFKSAVVDSQVTHTENQTSQTNQSSNVQTEQGQIQAGPSALQKYGVGEPIVAMLKYPLYKGEKDDVVLTLTSDQRIIILVILAGFIGGCIHTLNSLVAYIGRGENQRSWEPYYWVRPMIGGGIGLFVFMALKNGTGASVSYLDQSPFGPVAVAGLSGMYNREAISWLKGVFSALLAPAKKINDDPDTQNSSDSTTTLPTSVTTNDTSRSDTGGQSSEGSNGQENHEVD